jgi:large subunit ribosomal protein L4
MKRGAFISALSDKAQKNRITIIEDFDLEKIKTKDVVAILDKLGLADKKCLVLDETENKNAALSFKNISRAKYTRAPMANTYDIVNADILVITAAGLKKMEEVFV